MGIFDSFSWIDLPISYRTLSKNAEIDGKKSGYERAAKEYEPIYQELKRECERAIAEIQRQKHNCDVESATAIGHLVQLEEKLEDLQKRINDSAKQNAASCDISSSMKSFSGSGVWRDPRKDEIMWIWAEAEETGYSEAKKLYEEKLKALRDKLERKVADASKELIDYASLIAEVLTEIEDTQMKIADLEIALQED